MKKLAQFYECDGEKIKCLLCPHRCIIREGEKGICRVRQAIKDERGDLQLYSLNYGEVTSRQMEAIEEQPLFHFYPGTQVLSVGSFGCNLACSFCQSQQIVYEEPTSQYYSPEDLMNLLAEKYSGGIGIAFTYNEPSIWYEYVYDVAKLINPILPDKKVILVTNGYINEKPLRKLLPYIDAMNIDLKGDKEFYQRLCGGELEEVKKTISLANRRGCHVEVTVLLIGGENTNERQILEIGQFLESVNPNIVLHISRYFPSYKLDLPPTSFEELQKAYLILRQMLPYVEVANVSEEERKRLESYFKKSK